MSTLDAPEPDRRNRFSSRRVCRLLSTSPARCVVSPLDIRIPMLMHRLEFTDHQRSVFCVFSGTGVSRLRDFLNESPEYESLRDWPQSRASRVRNHDSALAHLHQPGNSRLAMGTEGPDGEAEEPEGIEEDDGLEGFEGSEMALDQIPAVLQAHTLFNPSTAAGMPPAPPMPRLSPHLLNSGLVSASGRQLDSFSPSPSQAQQGNGSRHQPTMIAGYSQAGLSSASFATVSPPDVNGGPVGIAGGSRAPPPGASTASMSGRQNQQDASPPSPTSDL